MDEFNHIDSLLAAADEVLLEIESLYQQSLSEHSLDSRLLIRVKNFLENLRSALDYLAQEIYSRYCAPASGKHVNVYFPILKKEATRKHFVEFMNGRFPGLEESCPKVYADLSSCQYMQAPQNEWLIKFNEICQENKHERFSAQTGTQKKAVKMIGAHGGSVSWTDGVEFHRDGSITFGENGSLEFEGDGGVEFSDDGVKVLGASIDYESQLPQIQRGDKLEESTWIDFRFIDIDELALPFLKLCAKQVHVLIDTIRLDILDNTPSK